MLQTSQAEPRSCFTARRARTSAFVQR